MNQTKKQKKGIDYWQSYSDMMAALLLVFVLVLAGTILQSHMKLEETMDALNEKNEQLEEILGVRKEIIAALKEAFSEDELTIDTQTGAIVFNSDLMFATADFHLSDAGKVSLVEFLPKYFGVLLSEEYIQYVGEIRIEGHTDDKGEYMYNLELSQNRALNVSAFILMNEHELFTWEQMEQLRALVTASGRSESDLVLNADGTVNRDASRRVEIQFQLKDDDMIKQMEEMVDEMRDSIS